MYQPCSRRSIFIFLFLLTLFFVSSIHADSLSGDLSRFESLYASTASKSHLRPIKLRTRSAAFGRLDIELDGFRTKNWRSSFVRDGREIEDSTPQVLLSGRLTRLGAGEIGTIPVAASYVDRGARAKLILHFALPNRITGRMRFHRVDVAIAADGQRARRIRMRSVPAAMLDGRSCDSGIHRIFPHQQRRAAQWNRSALVSWELEIATEADYEYYQLFGGSSNTEIAALINAAEVIYERDLGITFTIRGQRTQTSSTQPYTATDASALLTQLRNNIVANPPSPSADVTHLFSGKDFDGSTVGIAYVGVICANASYSMGANQRLSLALDYIVFAHELGHNFDAAHDSVTTPRTIMYPSVSTTQTSFSAITQGQVQSHLSTYASACLAAASTTPTATATPTSSTPTPTATPAAPTAIPTAPAPEATATPLPSGITLYLDRVKKRGVRVYVRALVLDGSEAPLEGHNVRIVRAAKSSQLGSSTGRVYGSRISNAFGIVTFRAPALGRYQLVADTPSGAVYSEVFLGRPR